MPTTKEAVLESRSTNPTRKATEIAKEVGVTRERVRQLLIKLGLPTNFRTPLLCQSCGRQIKTRSRSKLCRPCYLASLQSRQTTVTCENCGKQFYRKASTVRRNKKRGYKHCFCSRKCLGYWRGSEVGFHRKLNYDTTIALWNAKWTAREIALHLNTKRRSIENLIVYARKSGLQVIYHQRRRNGMQPLRKNS